MQDLQEQLLPACRFFVAVRSARAASDLKMCDFVAGCC